VGRDGRRDGDRLQAPDEGMARRHVVDRRRDDERALDGVRISGDVGRYSGEGEGQAYELPDDVGDDTPARHEAPAMRRGDEHDARDLRQRLDEQPAPEQVAGLVGQPHLRERPAADRVPDPIPAVDRLHLDQQAPLAVPDQHHPAEGQVRAPGVELRHRRAQRVAQLKGGQRHGLAGIVLEEPELEAAADLGIGLESR
jgi:hypothetical protein